MSERKPAAERSRDWLSPMLFAAVYALVVPLALALFALWLPLKSTSVQTLKEWQTLVGGVLALGAALIGGGFVYYQTGQSRRQEKERIARQHSAARAVLPLALSSLAEYAEAAVESLEDLRRTAVKHRIPPCKFEAPALHAGDIDRLKDAIEGALETVADRIARVISDVQVLNARLLDIRARLRRPTSLVLTANLDDAAIRAVTTYARCSDLFAYARRAVDIAPPAFPTPQSIRTALLLLGFDESTHEIVCKRAMDEAQLNQLVS